MERERESSTDEQTGRQTNTLIGISTDRQIDEQIYKKRQVSKTDRWTDRQ